MRRYLLEIHGVDPNVSNSAYGWRVAGHYTSAGQAAEAARHITNRARVVTVESNGTRHAVEVARPIPYPRKGAQ